MHRLALAGALLVTGALLAPWSSAHAAPETTTFTRDVAPILNAKCVACHRPGEVAPMALLTYQDARPYARSIKEKVATRQMPPWFADKSAGTFANDPSLTDTEIATITSWVDAGAPQGDLEGSAEAAAVHRRLAARRTRIRSSSCPRSRFRRPAPTISRRRTSRST